MDINSRAKLQSNILSIALIYIQNVNEILTRHSLIHPIPINSENTRIREMCPDGSKDRKSSNK